jgi:hypothetical protein
MSIRGAVWLPVMLDYRISSRRRLIQGQVMPRFPQERVELTSLEVVDAKRHLISKPAG